eukprot:400696-Alexandrium_andersonii.AAC.1
MNGALLNVGARARRHGDPAELQRPLARGGRGLHASRLQPPAGSIHNLLLRSSALDLNVSGTRVLRCRDSDIQLTLSSVLVQPVQCAFDLSSLLAHAELTLSLIHI